MTSPSLDHPVRVSTSRVGVGRRIIDLWRHRELLVAFTRNGLKVKYKNSVLGFFWSMANPALYLVVFYVVFEVILDSGIPNFPIFLLSGLLIWNFFSSSLGGATTSIVANSGLVRKVAFPREIIPLSIVGAALINFALQAVVLCAALVITQYDVGYRFLPLLPLALVVLVIVSSTFAVFLSALNVHLRDTGHFVELGLLAWFWLTPIIYPYMLIADKLGSKQWMALLNPVTSVVIAFQRAIYNQTTSVSEGTVTKILPVDAGFWWYAKNLAVVGGISLVLFTLALAYFGRVEGDFAEEL